MPRRAAQAPSASSAPAKKRAPSTSFVLERFLPYRLSVLAQAVSEGLHERYADPHGLSVAQWRVMAQLARHAPLSAQGLCAKTVMDKVTISRAVNALAARRLVERAIDAEDKRRSELRLTRAGAAMHAKIAPLALAFEAELVAALSPAERKALDALLEKLVARALLLAPLQTVVKP